MASLLPRPGSDRLSGTGPILIAGPTAVGKSAVALRLAERLGGEIISVDSMQVYRGLDIGTAKPGAAERARVPHHLLDVVNVSETFDAARFVSEAQVAIGHIQSRGAVPILCGGTGFYFRALLEGLGRAPAADPALRAELAATPLDDLLRELADRDPITWARIDRRNFRRVLRAVEVIRLTGRPFAEQRADWKAGPATPPVDGRGYGLARSLPDLQARIDARVETMFRLGLVEETRTLLAQGLGENPIALQAIGYRQVVEHLRGERSLADTIALVKRRTRHFAKRQMTWFRRQAALTWLELRSDEEPESVVERILGA